jgi:hypothetical protein
VTTVRGLRRGFIGLFSPGCQAPGNLCGRLSGVFIFAGSKADPTRSNDIDDKLSSTREYGNR